MEKINEMRNFDLEISQNLAEILDFKNDFISNTKLKLAEVNLLFL